MYLWLKAFHIIAVMAWMAGMLYLPRLYVYHSKTAPGSEASELFKIMEWRLLRIIINPAMIIAWILGGAMIALNADFMAQGWLHAKLSFLILMQLCHAYLARARRGFARDERPKSEKFWRFFNEVPTLLMIGIVIFVVLKPF